MTRVYFNYGDYLIINRKKIFGIIISGLIIGLVFNYFNPEGIPLIREKQELEWAPDSLFLIPENENDSILTDSTEGMDTTQSQQEQVTQKTTNRVKSDSEETLIQNVKKPEQKQKKENSETPAFTEPKAIKLEQAYSLYNKGLLFIDARDEADFLAGHITNSINIPFDDFDNHKQKLDNIPKENPVVIYCAGTECDLSHLLANLLFEKGYKQVYVFFGGWVEWEEANYPVEHPSETK